MAVVERSSSAAMVVPVTLHIYAAAFPIVCVDSAPPRRQLQVALESLRPANDDAGGREDWRAGEEINSCGSGPVQGEGLMCMARRAEAVRSRTIHSALAFLASTQKCGWFHGGSTVANIETAFHYVNCHPRGDPVSSLSNDYVSIVSKLCANRTCNP